MGTRCESESGKSKLTPLVSNMYGPESGLYGLLKDGETKM